MKQRMVTWACSHTYHIVSHKKTSSAIFSLDSTWFPQTHSVPLLDPFPYNFDFFQLLLRLVWVVIKLVLSVMGCCTYLSIIIMIIINPSFILLKQLVVKHT